MTRRPTLEGQADRLHALLSQSESYDQLKRAGRPRRRRYEKRTVSLPNSHTLTLSPQALEVLVRRLSRSMRKGYDSDLVECLVVGGRLTVEALLRVATRCSRSELLSDPSVEPTTVDEIEYWLVSHDRNFRPEVETLEAALEQAIDHLEAIIELRDPDAPLKAFLAIPELKRSLRLAGGGSG